MRGDAQYPHQLPGPGMELARVALVERRQSVFEVRKASSTKCSRHSAGHPRSTLESNLEGKGEYVSFYRLANLMILNTQRGEKS